MTSQPELSKTNRASVVGVGLIGGSVCLGLKAAGWNVHGVDLDAAVIERALSIGAIDAEGIDPESHLVVIAVPAAHVVRVTNELFEQFDSSQVTFTDVAGVKGTIAQALDDERFIGGHPMAGSELHGISGARKDLFVGATWVLTPKSSTPPEHYSRLLGAIRDLGAHGVALTPKDHDRIVALVSHVPHLVAASLMNEAAEAAESDAVLLQLAAGGFRDMTRIAAGDPSIWPDVCIENASAIVDGLDELMKRVQKLRDAVETGDRSTLLTTLQRASLSRSSLPGRVSVPMNLAEIRIPVPDRPGVLADITSAASDLGVSLVDLEIAHSIEGDRGVLIVIVDSTEAERYVLSLEDMGFGYSVAELR